MFNSIRWSMQIWHAGLLAVVLSGFGMASYYGIRQARFQEIDSVLSQNVELLRSSAILPLAWQWPGGPPGGQGNGPGPGTRPFFGRGGPDRIGGPPNDHGPGGPDAPNGPQPREGGFGGGAPNGPQPRDSGFGGPGGPNGQPPRDGGFGNQDQPIGPEGHDLGHGGGPDPNQGDGQPPQNGPPDRPPRPRLMSPIDVVVPTRVLGRFDDDQTGHLYFAVWTAEGSLIKSTASGDIPDPIGPRLVPQGPDPLALEDARIRSRGDLREAYVYGHFGTVMLVGRSIAADRVELRRSAWLLGATGGGVLLVGLVGGWLLSVRAVRPITAITYVAQDISASNLSRRIDKAGTSSELGTLAAVLNDTFARLESAFNQQIRFTADASHELRTPLTVIHTNVQLALARQRSAEEYRAMFQSCARASDRMKGLLDSLLLLARADAGSLPMSLADCDLKRIVEDSAAMLMPLAATKNIAVDLQLQSAPLKADASRLGQVVTNLLTNAIRYNRDGGTIVVTVAVDADDNARLSIADTGIGIPVENQPQLFERFYRVDFSRARDDGGTGLGLAICKTIVEAHRGTITFTSEPGKGSTFTVRLPR